MEHSQAVGKNPIHDMEIVSRQILPDQFVDIFEPPLAADLEVATSDQLIEIRFRVPMTKGGRNENHPVHAGIVATAIPPGKSGSDLESRAVSMTQYRLYLA